MDRIYTRAYRLQSLRRVIESGVFAVPELQREFVWNGRKACDLLDSIYKNYPIGTILVWKTEGRNEGQLRKQLHILPPFNRQNREIFFLVDGQQRLSVLWHLVRGQPDSVKNEAGNTVDFGSIYFNPYARGEERRFLYRSRVVGDLADELVSVVDLLSPTWRHRIGRHGPRAVDRMEACRNRINDYTVNFVFCETNDLTEVRESFVRINSLGMRIGAADRAFARASKFNMRGLVRDAQMRLKHGFSDIKRTTILQTIALALGGRDLGERAIDAMTSKLETSAKERQRFERMWPHLREAFGRAADFAVFELGVPNAEFLPSEPMMVVLALYFLHNGNVRPSKAAKSRLKRWFWSTAVGARYTGRGYRPNILADAEFVRRLAKNGKATLEAKVRVQLHTLRQIEYGRPGPLSNAFFCLLQQSQPRYLEDGSTIPLGETSSRRNRKDKHHVFPRHLLTRHGIGPDRFNSILNICYLVARENQSVGTRAPASYLSDVPRNGLARKKAMTSHLIPNVAEKGVWDRSVKRGFREFLDQRALLVARGFEKKAGVRLFERRG